MRLAKPPAVSHRLKPALRAAMAVENSRRGYAAVEHHSVEEALASVNVAPFERHGGSVSPCRWLCLAIFTGGRPLCPGKAGNYVLADRPGRLYAAGDLAAFLHWYSV